MSEVVMDIVLITELAVNQTYINIIINIIINISININKVNN